jgi:hypothetical protein
MVPGAKGTRRLVREYGPKLVCVRYRYDEAGRKRIKTAEIVVEEAPWTPPQRHLVLVAVKAWETALHARLRKAGARWTGKGPFWRVRYDRAVKLGLATRLSGTSAANITSKKLLPAETEMFLPAETSTTRPNRGFCK